MAFHDPLDAVSWALEVQHRLLLLDWPADLLSQPDAALQCCQDQQMHDIVVFKGLRVRIAMHCGRPDAVQVSASRTSVHAGGLHLTYVHSVICNDDAYLDSPRNAHTVCICVHNTLGCIQSMPA